MALEVVQPDAKRGWGKQAVHGRQQRGAASLLHGPSDQAGQQHRAALLGRQCSKGTLTNLQNPLRSGDHKWAERKRSGRGLPGRNDCCGSHLDSLLSAQQTRLLSFFLSRERPETVHSSPNKLFTVNEIKVTSREEQMRAEELHASLHQRSLPGCRSSAITNPN